MIKALKPLVMMQLKDKLDFSFLKSTKQTIAKIILTILAFGVVTGAFFGFFFLADFLNIFSMSMAIPPTVIVVIFTVMEILTLLSCTFGLMKALYFSKDNPVLLTLPASTNQVFISKIIVYFIYELKRTLFFIVPLLLAYGLVSGLPLYFILWVAVSWIILALFNTAFAALFSIFAMLLTMFLRNFGFVKVLLFLGAVGIVIYALVTVINLIPENFDIRAVWGTIFWAMQDFLNAFSKIMFPFAMLVELFIGKYRGLKAALFTNNTLTYFGLLVGAIIVLFTLAFLISRPLFFKMAAKPFEYRKVTHEFKRKNRKTNSFLSAVKAQTLLICRTSDDLFALMGCAVSMPILILLLNRIFAAISTRALGDAMTISFNLLIMLLIALASNGKMASVYSREGSAAYLNKTRPNEYRTNLIAKITPNAVVMIISIIASCAIVAKFSALNTFNDVCFALVVIFAYVMHLLWSAESDVVNPQSSHYATTGEHPNNPNETKSSITMFIVSFITCLISLFLCIENIKVAFVKIVLIFLALLIYRVWSYLSTIKYFYKEK